MKNRTHYTLAFVLFLFLSCSENDKNKSNELREREITEDSILTLINSFKVNSPDTFVFLNYWYGMPTKYIEVLNRINIKNKDILSWSEANYGEFDSSELNKDVFINLHANPDLTIKILFETNPSTECLEMVRLNSSWIISSKRENYKDEKGELKSREIYIPAKENESIKEINSLNQYLVELFGKNYYNKFDSEVSYLAYGKPYNAIARQETDYMTNTIKETSESPYKCYKWISNGRCIISVCTLVQKYYDLESEKHRVIGKEFHNTIVFTSIDFVRNKMEVINKKGNQENSRKIIERTLQKEKL
jgi:hypothetical protein